MSSSPHPLDLALLAPWQREQLQRFLPIELAHRLRAQQQLSQQDLRAVHAHLSRMLDALRAAAPGWVGAGESEPQGPVFVDATALCVRLRPPALGGDLLSGLSQVLSPVLHALRAWGGDLLGLDAGVVIGLFRGADHARLAAVAAWGLQAAQRGARGDLLQGIGIASGPVLLLGAGSGRRRLPLALGAPLEQALLAAQRCPAETIQLHASSAALTRESMLLAEDDEGGALLAAPPGLLRLAAPLAAPDASLLDLGALLDHILALEPFVAPDLLSALAGDPLAQPGGGERRQVVTLYLSISGLHAIAERCFPEHRASAARLCDMVADAICEAVEGFGGALVSALPAPGGHRMLALFGAPVAHEHDALSALRAALDLRARLRRLSQEAATLAHELGLPAQLATLRLRVGMNAGLVTAGLLGRPDRFEYSVAGEAAQLAAQLLDAGRGLEADILLGAGLAETLGELLDVDALRLPIAEDGPAEAYALKSLRPGAASRRLRRAPLLGREHEQRRLVAALDAACGGQRRIVFIEGEAGVGKSRLALELAALAGDEVTCLVTDAQGLAPTSYSLFRALLRSLCGLPQEAPAALVFRRLYSTLERLAPARSADLWPALGGLLGLPGAEQGFAAHDGATQQRALAWAATALLDAAARRQTLLWICEDLHEADTASLALLEQLIGLLGDAPLLICATYRPRQSRQGGADPMRQLVRAVLRDQADAACLLRLEGLGESESAALLDSLLPDLAPQQRADLLEQSAGNPLFLELLAESLARRGVVAGRQLASGPLSVPLSLRQLIAAQVDSLPVEVRQLAHVAAVIATADRAFPHWLLEKIIDRPQTMDLRLAELLRAQVIELVPGQPSRHYRFRHTLVQTAIYDRLLESERHALHRRVGLVLHYLDPAQREARLDALAYHCYEGQLAQLAITYNLRAGERAQRTYANREALRAFRRVLGLSRQHDAAQYEALAREGLGALHILRGRLGPARAQFERALQLGATLDAVDDQIEAQARRRRLLALACELAGDYAEAEAHCRNGLLLSAGLRQPAMEPARIYAQLAGVLWRRGEYAEAERACHEGLAALPPEPAAPGERALLLQRLATIDGERGMYADALRALERSLGLARQAGDLSLTASVLNNLGMYLDSSGDAARALACYEESLELKTRIGDTVGRVTTIGNMGVIHMLRGDYAQARRCFEECRALAEQYNLPGQLAHAHLNLGQLCYEQGLLPAADHSLRRACELFDELEEGGSLAHALSILGDVALAWHEPLAALGYARRALEIARAIGNSVFETCALRVGGEAWLACGQLRESEASLDAAWQIQQQVGDPYDLALLLAARARLALAKGERREAAALAAEALAYAREQHIAVLIAQLERFPALDELERSSSQPA